MDQEKKSVVSPTACLQPCRIRDWVVPSSQDAIVMPPLPLRGGRVRPTIEPSSPCPPRFSCSSKTALDSCGYAFVTTTYYNLCFHGGVRNKVVDINAPQRWVRPCLERITTMEAVDNLCSRCGRPPTHRSKTEKRLKDRQVTKRPRPAAVTEGDIDRRKRAEGKNVGS